MLGKLPIWPTSGQLKSLSRSIDSFGIVNHKKMRKTQNDEENEHAFSNSWENILSTFLTFTLTLTFKLPYFL